MFETIKNHILLKYPDAEVYLYGSYAKWCATEESDIDISIYLPKRKIVDRYDRSLSDELTKIIWKEVNVCLCTIDNEFNLLKL